MAVKTHERQMSSPAPRRKSKADLTSVARVALDAGGRAFRYHRARPAPQR
ncbi:MAG: hypothetical protein R3E39_12340 [Anaerolineae bacterium]